MTYPAETVYEVQGLHRAGLTALQISQRTGVPRGTVRTWLAGRLPLASRPGGPPPCRICSGFHTRLADLEPPYAYLLGLYLGDGCIATHPRGVYKLRISCDAKYPGIMNSAVFAIHAVMPRVAINRVRTGNCVEIYSYSKSWVCVFPQHGPGKKHARPIKLAPWQRQIVAASPQLLLRGLIHSDGCRFMNTGRNWRQPRYAFYNLSADIRAIFCDACAMLELRWTTSGNTIYVSRKADVARLDQFIGPKR
jgi:hypothetical protein